MMTNALTVKHELDKANADLADAAAHLGATWALEDRDAIGRLVNASEALMRALSSVSLAVERLAELPACDGSHTCDCNP